MTKPYIICHTTTSVDDKPLFMDGAAENCELVKVEVFDGNLVLNYKRVNR